MTFIKELEAGSAVYGQLPVGCQHCRRGSKMVLLVTGKCGKGCFYCPLSLAKKDKDCFYADEMPLEKEKEALVEASLIRAHGTGITGGDPLAAFDRTERMVRLLKDNFGDEHHIHMYTATLDADRIGRLVDAGLDELRYHPMPGSWQVCEENRPGLARVLELPVDVGVEIPSLPDMQEDMFALVGFLDEMGVLFLNINELEHSEGNYQALLGRGYRARDDASAVMEGSREAARAVLEYAEEENLAISVHYCSSGFKDSVQLRSRLARRAETIARPMDVVTEDGTLLKGVVEPGELSLEDALSLVMKRLKADESLVIIDKDKNRIEVAPWVLEKGHKKLPLECFIVEEYPTWDRLEVERRPLGKSRRIGRRSR